MCTFFSTYIQYCTTCINGRQGRGRKCLTVHLCVGQDLRAAETCTVFQALLLSSSMSQGRGLCQYRKCMYSLSVIEVKMNLHPSEKQFCLISEKNSCKKSKRKSKEITDNSNKNSKENLALTLAICDKT